MPESFNQEAIPPVDDSQSIKLREEIDEVYRANERLADDYDAAERRIRELEELLAKQRDQLVTSQQQLDAASSERADEAERVRHEHAGAKTEVERLTTLVAKLEHEKLESDSLLQNRHGQIDALTEQRDQALNTAASANRSNEQISAKLDQLEEEYSQSVRELDQAKRERADLAAENDSLKAHAEKSRTEALASKEALTELQRQHEAIKQTNQKLIDDAEKTSLGKQSLESNNASLTEQVSLANNQLISVKAEMESFRDETIHCGASHWHIRTRLIDLNEVARMPITKPRVYKPN